MPSPSQTSWNNLPNEIKLEIIKKFDKSSRLAVRTFSLNDRQLVDSVPYRTTRKISLRTDPDGKWRIEICKIIYGGLTILHFDKFPEFNNKLEEEIKNTDCIQYLEAFQKKTSKQLKFTKNGKLLKVRELSFLDYNEDALDILTQIDPCYLKRLDLGKNGIHPEIFDSPQAKQVHYLQGFGDNMTDKQLLETTNPEISLENTKKITTAGINKYIQKCLRTLDEKAVSFRIQYSEAKTDVQRLFQGTKIQEIISGSSNISRSSQGVVRLNSSSKNSQLEVEYCHYFIKAVTIRKNQKSKIPYPEVQNDQRCFKSVKYLTISPLRLTITEKNSAPITYVFKSDDDLQKKLTEEANKLNYIKNLVLHETSRDWNICLPGKQIAVGKLSVDQETFSSEFLLQLEPFHLKEIKIDVKADDVKMYDMPQLIHAQRIEISDCRMKDHQLVKINSIQSLLTFRNKSLTDSGINKFLKKTLTNLNLHDYTFYLQFPGNAGSASERLEGLQIFSEERFSRENCTYFLNSSFPKFKLEITDMNGSIFGQRINSNN